MSRRRPNISPVLAVLGLGVAIALAISGCGETAEPGRTASLIVTTDFGQKVVLGPKQTPITAGLTAMRQLQSHAEIKTSYGGRFVNAISGKAGSASAGDDWLFYVDGEQSETGASAWRVKPDQRLQWDFHQWRDIAAPEAIVGAYPRPLANTGAILLCKPSSSAACTAAGKKFPHSGEKPGAINVVVGAWDEIAGTKGVPDLTRPALDNGALAGFTGKPGSRKLQLLGGDGKISTTNGAGAGLVVASRAGKTITWIVTGTDAQGAEAAVGLLDEQVLKNKFAVASLGPYGPTALPTPAGPAK